MTYCLWEIEVISVETSFALVFLSPLLESSSFGRSGETILLWFISLPFWSRAAAAAAAADRRLKPEMRLHTKKSQPRAHGGREEETSLFGLQKRNCFCCSRNSQHNEWVFPLLRREGKASSLGDCSRAHKIFSHFLIQLFFCRRNRSLIGGKQASRRRRRERS